MHDVPHASLALLALQLAEPYERARGSQSFADRDYAFWACVNHLVCQPGFSREEAERAAEFLKAEAMHPRQNWLRFGVGSGSYFAAAAPFLTYLLVTRSPAQASLAALVTTPLLFALFAVGTKLDDLLQTYQTAEGLLKSAAKHQTTSNVRTIVRRDVRDHIEAEHRWMLRVAILGLLTTVLLALLVRSSV